MIATPRLRLVPVSIASIEAALSGPEALAAALGVAVPPTWPPDLLDRPALEFTRARLVEHPDADGWWFYFVLLPEAMTTTLIGVVGYTGPPDTDGIVEVGYGIVADRQRRGYATEATRALVDRAFATPAVTQVVAQTLPGLTPSIGVLEKLGFRLIGAGSEPGVIRYRLDRTAPIHR
jgi:RimJ/RimL family protein N-acetyltransferase